MLQRRPRPTLFPYTTLFRSIGLVERSFKNEWTGDLRDGARHAMHVLFAFDDARSGDQAERAAAAEPDRKSTRLNSSHANISYAVICLKKKKAARCRTKRTRS